MATPSFANPDLPEPVTGHDEPAPLVDVLIRPFLNRPERNARLPEQTLNTKPIDFGEESDSLWHRIRRGFSIQNINSQPVPQRIAILLNDQQSLYTLLERAGPYLYYIVNECEERGLPTELALLPFVESSFNPHATSPAGAAGLWQFRPSTARDFKLQQTGMHDERRDITASTRAALDYLSQLYEMYGDWHLALAAYNWGQGSVKRALQTNRSNNLGDDYLSLRMPDETRNYVPKLQAIKNIIDSPDAFNFTLPPIENKPFFSSVARIKGIDVTTAARLADLPIETFRDLNPGFRAFIPPDPQRSLLIPTEKAELFENALQRYAVHSPRKVGLKNEVQQLRSDLIGTRSGKAISDGGVGILETGGDLQDTRLKRRSVVRSDRGTQRNIKSTTKSIQLQKKRMNTTRKSH